jgi:hypothetical protein
MLAALLNVDIFEKSNDMLLLDGLDAFWGA